MPLHIIKLSVGSEDIDDMYRWLKDAKAGRDKFSHTTRMFPRRKDEILPGGSLYWVIRGEIACRERIVDMRAFVDKEGIKRCRLVLDGKVVPVLPKPRGPFQGWRYFPAKEAPPDLARGGKGVAQLPEALRRELRELGLL